jgi:hypothetical protein
MPYAEQGVGSEWAVKYLIGATELQAGIQSTMSTWLRKRGEEEIYQSNT